MKKIVLIVLFALSLAMQGQNQKVIVNNKNHPFYLYFQNAYSAYPEIPRGVLEAIAHTTTRIHHITPDVLQSCIGLPKVYGVMGLTLDGKNYFRNNLLEVSQLSGYTQAEIITDPEKNILAFAKAYSSLLVSKNIFNAEIENQLPVLIELSELPDNNLQANFALNSHLYSVLSFLNDKKQQDEFNFPPYQINLIDVFGKKNFEVLSSSEVIIAEDAIMNKDGEEYQKDGGNPAVQSADYGPAIWNAAASCNSSSRSGTAISAVVIHDVEGSYAGCISWFKNCSASVSAHYVVRSSDGQVTQMVLESGKAWHVGNHNPYTIGIEHEGYQAQTGWYTNAMYTASANLVKDICNSGYGINPTTCYNGPSCSGLCLLSTSIKIKGHQHYSSQTHNDPGPNWDWYTYYALVNGTNTSCGTPSGLTSGSVTSTGATLSWTAVSGASGYNVQYRKTTTTSWTSTTSTTNSKAISGLLASTTYEFQVQAICSGSTGSFSGSSNFTTLATTLSNDNCTGAQVLTSGTACVSAAGSIAGATASGLAKASCDVFSGTPLLKDVWFSFVANNPSHTIKVTPSSGLDAVVALYTSCTGGQIGCNDNGGGGGGIETITTTNLSAGTTYYIRVYSYGSSTPSTTTFNICVTNPAPPSCGIPTGLSVTSLTENSATLNWAVVSGAVSYNLQYRKTGTTAWTSTTSATNSKAISGLNSSTSYEFQVQAVCSGTTGSFSGSATFTTASPSTSNDNCSGAQPLIPGTTCTQTMGNLAGATASGLPKASCDAFSGTQPLKDVWFSFVANNPSHTIKITPSSGLDAVLALYSSCNGTQIGCNDNGGGPGGAETISTSNLTSGVTYFIRIYSYGSSAPSTTTYNICVTYPSPPSCGTPSGLSASSITTNTATLNWTAVSGAASYNVHYKTTTSNTWISTTSATNSKTISGLVASTTYEFRVQAVCPGTTGAFSATFGFTSAANSSEATITVGNGTTAYSAHPYGTVYMDERVEYIITKNELISAGWTSATPGITSLAFNVSSASSQIMNNFTISLSHTTASSFSSTSFLTGTNPATVYSANTTATSGWNSYAFGSPFSYNGTSNLLITICWNNASFTSNSSVITTNFSNYVALYYRQDVSNGGVCSQATGTRSLYRPNTKMTFAASTDSTPTPPPVNCDLTLKTTIEGFNVYKHNPSGAIMYKAKMAIDADGSPRAYGPNNSGLDYTANAGSPGNWWGVVTDGNGDPVIQNANDPYPGMYVSTTSLVNSSYATTNPLRYTNSETVPFFVLPSAVTSLGGISIGDMGYVYNTITGQGCYAVFADGGPAGKLGEGSIFLADQLGINSNPKTGGTSSGIIDYIVFPQSGYGQGTIPTIAQINNIGLAKINSAGGTGITSCLNNPSPNKQEEVMGETSELNETSDLQFEIFPNPSDGTMIYGKIQGAETNSIQIIIYNVLGQEVFHERVSVSQGSFSFSLTDAHLIRGMYLLAGTVEKSKLAKRIVIR